MAIDRDTIVSLHKKSESNLTIAKELQIRRETIWKVVKKFRETGQTSNRPGQGRKRTVRTKRIVKNTSSDLNPLDISVPSILESKACRTSHDSLENLKAKLQREWALIPQEVLCASCNAFQGILKQIIKNKGHIE